jgi:uncharacterized protein (TIRG00374 family)
VTKKSRYIFLILGKLFLSALLIYWMLSAIDLRSAIDSGRGADLYILMLGLGLMFCQLGLAAYRWSFIARRSGVDLKAREAFVIFWESVFFGQFLPSSMGGDFWRVYKTSWHGPGTTAAFHAVFADRVSGAFSLFGLVFLANAISSILWRSSNPQIALMAMGFAASIAVGLALLILSRSILARFSSRRIFAAGYRLATMISDTLTDRLAVVVAVVTGALGHILAVAAVWCIASALSVPVTLLDCFLVVPVALLLAMVPVTIGGWGIREGALAAGFTHLGVPLEAAVAISLLFGMYLALMGLTGGALWLVRSAGIGGASDRGRRRPERVVL